MEKYSDKIIIGSIVAIASITIAFDLLAYNANEAKGIGFLYFGFFALIIFIVSLLAISIICFLISRNKTGKALLFSILYSVLTYFAVQFIFYFFLFNYKSLIG